MGFGKKMKIANIGILIIVPLTFNSKNKSRKFIVNGSPKTGKTTLHFAFYAVLV